MTEINYTDLARTRVQENFQGMTVLSAGDSYQDGDMEGYVAARTVTVDRGGRGVAIAVYEVVFEDPQNGFIMEIATTYGDASFNQWAFKS